MIALLVGLSLFGGSGDDPGRPAGRAPTSTGVTGPRREPEAVGTDPLGLVADVEDGKVRLSANADVAASQALALGWHDTAVWGMRIDPGK